MASHNQGLLHQNTPPPGPGRTRAPPFVTGRSDAADLPMREMQATLCVGRRINVTLPEYKGKSMETGYTGNIRQPDHSSVRHPVTPIEAALPAIFKVLRLPSGIKPPGKRSLGYRGMLGLSI